MKQATQDGAEDSKCEWWMGILCEWNSVKINKIITPY